MSKKKGKKKRAPKTRGHKAWCVSRGDRKGDCNCGAERRP